VQKRSNEFIQSSTFSLDEPPNNGGFVRYKGILIVLVVSSTLLMLSTVCWVVFWAVLSNIVCRSLMSNWVLSFGMFFVRTWFGLDFITGFVVSFILDFGGIVIVFLLRRAYVFPIIVSILL